MLVNSRKWIATLTVIAMAMTGCTDDDLLPKPGNDTDMMFNITIPSSWGQLPAPALAPAPEVAINPMSGGDKDTLYLVSRAYALPDSIVPVKSRGTQINNITDFHAEAGVSAICYTGTYDEAQNEWTTNMAHDIKLNTGTGKLEKTLYWPGAGKIRFFSYAPYGGATHSAADHKGSPYITFTVNTDPEKQVDLMTATIDVSGSQNSSVSLDFRHALTGIMFKAQDGMLSGDVTSITISKVHGSGTNIIGTKEWTVTDDKYNYELKGPFTVGTKDDSYAHENESKDNLKLTDASSTMFLMPQTLPEGAKITVNFTDNLTGTERTLTADLTGTWQPGKLVVYTISTSGIVVEPVVEYKIQPKDNLIYYSGIIEDVEIGAYLKVVQHNNVTKTDEIRYLKTDWSIKSKVSTEGSEPFTCSMIKDDGKEFTPSKGGVSQADITDDLPQTFKGRLKVECQPIFDTMREPFGYDLTTLKGKENEYIDLSVGPDGTESSNCYVVNNPGYYKLPLVYGNTLGHPEYLSVEGVDETEATNKGIWTEFKDHENKAIKSPKINGAEECVLVWQDSPGLITDVKKDGDYLRFRVREESMSQGNALVAVKNASGTIIWSWHIWVTHYKWDGSDPEECTINARVTDREYSFGPANIGYCDRHKGNSERNMKIYMCITMPDKTVKEITLGENFLQEEIQASIAGDNTYYQWGRKDPMLGGIYNNDIKDITVTSTCRYKNGALAKYNDEFDMTNKRYYPDKYEFKRATSRQLMSWTISHPNEFVLGDNQPATKDPGHTWGTGPIDTRSHWRDGGKVINAWNALIKAEVKNTDKFPTASDPESDPADFRKTIYDPSPRGYMVPPSNAFSKFVKAGYKSGYAISEFASGYEEIKDEDEGMVIGYELTPEGGKKITFWLTGVRDMGPRRYDEYGDMGPDSDFQKHNKYNKWEHADFTWPAHRKLTFIASSSIYKNTNDEEDDPNMDQCMIFYLNHINSTIRMNTISRNGYGFSIRPVKDKTNK